LPDAGGCGSRSEVRSCCGVSMGASGQRIHV
jgi:hypothetical protein